jgi:hypothetical protein
LGGQLAHLPLLLVTLWLLVVVVEVQTMVAVAVRVDTKLELHHLIQHNLIQLLLVLVVLEEHQVLVLVQVVLIHN